MMHGPMNIRNDWEPGLHTHSLTSSAHLPPLLNGRCMTRQETPNQVRLISLFYMSK